MFGKNTKYVLFCNLFCACVQASGLTGATKDLTTPRANTLFDDADDIQRQLDNEARDRFKNGKSQTLWVFHFPTRKFSTESYRPRDSTRGRFTNGWTESPITFTDKMYWNYYEQSKWSKEYPDCIGRSQSPVDLPYKELQKVKGARRIFFKNHDEPPETLSIGIDDNNVKLTGTWSAPKRPVIYGGAARGRRYIFDSILLHGPSEHTIGGIQYPIESQAFYVSAEYGSKEDALRHASNDKMALLGVTTLYKFSNHTDKGLATLLKAVLKSYGKKTLGNLPLKYFNPPFKEYVCYQGSLTAPPCTESVLWLVKARSQFVTRAVVDAVQEFAVNGQHYFVPRQTQPLNDRKIFFFN